MIPLRRLKPSTSSGRPVPAPFWRRPAPAPAIALTLALACCGLTAPDSQAQAGSGNRPGGISARERDAALERAKAALDAARRQKASGQAADEVQKAATAEGGRQLKAAAAAALASRRATPDPGTASKRADERATLDQAKAVATPEAAEFIRASDAAPPPPRAGLIAQATPAAPAPAPATGDGDPGFDPSRIPVPERVPALPKDKPEPSGQILISASKLGYFDANNRIAIFSGDVAVDHPGFDLFCEHLEVHFKEKPASPAPPPEPAPEAAGTPGEGAAPATPQTASGDPGTGTGIGEIDFVVATGKEVKILKLAADGEMQIGKCKKAIYTANEGTLEMSIWPQAQRGRTLVNSLAEHTRIAFSENGTMEVHGPNETKLVKEAPETRTPQAPGGP